MGRLRTSAIAIVLAVSASSVAAESDLLRTFAYCTGRLSAQMEHQWLMADPDADRTEAQRAVLVDLLEALQDEADGRTVLGWRVSAKMAQAALLTRATFNDDPDDARYASRLATQQIAGCTALLLS